MRVWEWADAHTENGHALSVTALELSELLDMPGIGEAMVAADWIVEDPSGITFVNFDRWNLKTGKARLLTTLRKRRERRKER